MIRLKTHIGGKLFQFFLVKKEPMTIQNIPRMKYSGTTKGLGDKDVSIQFREMSPFFAKKNTVQSSAKRKTIGHSYFAQSPI